MTRLLDRPDSDEWSRLTSFNTLAIYAQPAVRSEPWCRFESIYESFAQSLRRDGAFLARRFGSAAEADTAVHALVTTIPGLAVVSQEPLIAVRAADLKTVFADQSRAVMSFGGEKACYIQYSSNREAEAFARRVTAQFVRPRP